MTRHKPLTTTHIGFDALACRPPGCWRLLPGDAARVASPLPPLLLLLPPPNRSITAMGAAWQEGSGLRSCPNQAHPFSSSCCGHTAWLATAALASA
jgi:hypothetical protein